MNHLITDGIIILISIIILPLINIQMRKKQVKQINLKYIFIIVIWILLVAVISYIIEYKVLIFKKIENAFNYKFPNAEIVEIFDYKDFSTVIYKTDSDLSVSNFSKNNNKWKLQPEPKAKIKSIYNNECFLIQYFISNDMIIIVSCTDLNAIVNNTKEKKYIVTDDKDNVLKKISFRWRGKSYYSHDFYMLVKNRETFISINGEQIQIEK